MRYLLILLLLPFASIAQEPLTYTAVKEANGNLEAKAKDWLSKTCTETKDLSGSASMLFNSKIFYGNLGTKGEITYKINIYTKEGKYKYEISQFRHIGNPNNRINLSFGLITTDKECPYHMKGQKKKWENSVWKEIQDRISAEMKIVIPSLEKAMNADNDF